MSESDAVRSERILVAGGAGYIGSHMVRALLDAGCDDVAVIDNLSSGHRQSVPSGVRFFEADLRDRESVARVLDETGATAVMHFAASSLVGESVADPLKYYDNNVGSCVSLLSAMKEKGVKRLIFSSTAAVYGEPDSIPIPENAPLRPSNPYGATKLAVERLLADCAAAGFLEYIALRYFNACGAYAGGGLGEDHEPETHLIPNLLRAAADGGTLTIHGDDYETIDGTCLRDYVHVMDLADAHLAALLSLGRSSKNEAFNLGNGSGYTVRQVIDAAARVTGSPVNVVVGPRRAGDPARLVASSAKAKRVLSWKAARGLDEILRDAWEWEKCLRSENAGVQTR